MAEQPEKPKLVLELEKEIKALKGRVDLCEDALRDLWEYYQNLDSKRS